MRHFWTVLSLIFLSGILHFFKAPTRLTLLGELGELNRVCLEAQQGIGIETEGGQTILVIQDKQEAVEGLTQALESLGQTSAILQLNMANADTLEALNGEPYRRQYPIYGTEGEVSAIVVDGSDLNWCYDPSHPFAEQEGPRAGYWARPNVNVEYERTCLQNVEQESRIARELLLRLAPEVVIPDKPLWSLPKVERTRVPAPAPVFDAELLGGFCLEALDDLQPLKQSNSVSCGQTSVAVCLNALTGRKLTDMDIDQRYGFQLLKALKQESPNGVDWVDAGDLSLSNKELILKALSQKLPVIVAVNGPRFSDSGRGNIVTLAGADEHQVSYLDPFDGKCKTASWEAFLEAPAHPDGNFIFLPTPERKRMRVDMSPICPSSLKE